MKRIQPNGQALKVQRLPIVDIHEIALGSHIGRTPLLVDPVLPDHLLFSNFAEVLVSDSAHEFEIQRKGRLTWHCTCLPPESSASAGC